MNMATVCLLGLVTMVLGLATAGSVPPSKPTPTGSGCHLAMPPTHQWRILVKHPESYSQPLPQPSCLLFLTSPQVQEHPKALQAEVALTLKVWENITDSALDTILGQPLHTLSHIHSQLQTCTQPQPTAEHRPLSRHLSCWLHRLQEAQSKETPGCLEASVTLNLFHLLTWDLKCVASEDQCV
uniref:Uncharacterized protein n=1 Tax=Mus spicilegus TaxID=10103 RepID=A0A8C6G532_MUSSI